MGEDYVKFGHYRGGKVSVPVPLAASQVLKPASGLFVHLDGSGNAVRSTDGANEIFGYAELDGVARTTSATAGNEVANVIIDPSAVFRIPVLAGTYVATMRGKTCDLKVTSDVQGADLGANTDVLLIVVDGDLVNNDWVDVMINQKERAQSGVV